jgi:hypothetical protein
MTADTDSAEAPGNEFTSYVFHDRTGLTSACGHHANRIQACRFDTLDVINERILMRPQAEVDTLQRIEWHGATPELRIGVFVSGKSRSIESCYGLLARNRRSSNQFVSNHAPTSKFIKI